MADLDRLDALARAYDAAVHKIRQDLTAFASQMWASMASTASSRPPS